MKESKVKSNGSNYGKEEVACSLRQPVKDDKAKVNVQEIEVPFDAHPVAAALRPGTLYH